MKEKLLMRFASKSDIERITDIYNQAIESKISTGDTKKFKPEERITWFDHYSSDKYPIYVFEIYNSVVAYATLSPYRNGRIAMSKIAEISFFVDFNYHQKGIGSYIMENVINDCKRLKKKTLLAFILDVNPASASLLEKFGFEVWGKLPNAIEFDTYRCSHLIYGKRLNI